MGNPLRDRRAPRDFAANRQVIDFEIKVGELGQLAAIVDSDLASLEPDKLPADWRDSAVSGRLRFGFADAQNDLPMLEGEVQVTLDAVCQRCLEPMALPLTVELKLLFANEEQADVEDGFEVWELDEENFRPIELVEEALVMALPLAAVHGDSANCRATDDEESDAAETVRPFAALRAQMEKDN